MRFSFIVICALLSVGCVATEDKNLISTAAAVGQGNLREWDTLTPAQQKEAQTNMVAAVCVLDHDINGTALPKQFEGVAGVTTAAPGGQ